MSSRPQDRASTKALAARREQLAVSMALAGATYQQIADSLMPCPRHNEMDRRAIPGCADCTPLYANRGTAYRAVQRALKRDFQATLAEREELRQLQLARIHGVLRSVYPRALQQGPDQDRAILSVVRLLDREARLQGLDAPIRIERTDELDAEIDQLLAQLQQLDHPDKPADQEPADQEATP